MGNAGVDAPGGASIGGPSTGGAPAGGASVGGGASAGGVGAVGPGGVAAPGQAAQAPDAYSLQGIYFKRESYPTRTACLNAAYEKGLPLDVCR